MDWSDKDKLAVAIQQDIFLYNHCLKETSRLDLDKNGSIVNRSVITSVKWQKSRENMLALGYQDRTLKVWDTEKKVIFKTIHDHDMGVISIGI